jgi:hypothetical protein
LRAAVKCFSIERYEKQRPDMKALAKRSTASRGRPRSFDRDEALEHAMQVFWRQGYESTTIADLTKAMGINPPSLYAAFGDKEKLFLAAVERYGCNVGATPRPSSSLPPRRAKRSSDCCTRQPASSPTEPILPVAW